MIRKSHLLALLLLAVFGANACKKADSKSDQKDFHLTIRPEQPSSKPEPDPKTGFLSETFDLPASKALDLLKSATSATSNEPSSNGPDPFGSTTSSKPSAQAPDPFEPSPPPPSGPVHQAFEEIGIPFPPGTSASYDPESGKLTVIQTPEAIGLIRMILAEFREVPDSAAIRFEFYEVPALLALRHEQSAAAHFDDTPEWEALQKLLGEDGIRLLEVATIQSKSGERAKFEDGEVVVYRSGTDKVTENGNGDAAVVFEQRLVGTIIEMDLVTGADGYTMDLNFALEYHSAPPEWISTSNGPDSSDIPPATVFHMKKLITNITIHDGQTRLLTSWTPTGKPEFADNSRRILVFVSANLQREH
jgi:hypothetical protein